MKSPFIKSTHILRLVLFTIMISLGSFYGLSQNPISRIGRVTKYINKDIVRFKIPQSSYRGLTPLTDKAFSQDLYTNLMRQEYMKFHDAQKAIKYEQHLKSASKANRGKKISKYPHKRKKTSSQSRPLSNVRLLPHKEVNMEFQVDSEPEEVAKEEPRKLDSKVEDELNKINEILRQIRYELQMTPQIKMEDINEEFRRLFGFILIENGSEFKAECAA